MGLGLAAGPTAGGVFVFSGSHVLLHSGQCVMRRPPVPEWVNGVAVAVRCRIPQREAPIIIFLKMERAV